MAAVAISRAALLLIDERKRKEQMRKLFVAACVMLLCAVLPHKAQAQCDFGCGYTQIGFNLHYHVESNSTAEGYTSIAPEYGSPCYNWHSNQDGGNCDATVSFILGGQDAAGNPFPSQYVDYILWGDKHNQGACTITVSLGATAGTVTIESSQVAPTINNGYAPSNCTLFYWEGTAADLNNVPYFRFVVDPAPGY